MVACECAAQTNLVPNPSFEENFNNYICIYDLNDSVQWPSYWTIPNATDPDYMHSPNCDIYRRVPENFCGYQIPYDGNAYIFIDIVSDSLVGFFWREYIQIKLNEVLVLDHKYCFSTWISLADSTPRATDDFGVFFSDTAIHRNDSYNFPFTPQIRNPEGRFLIDKINWVLISGSFISSGGEKYLTIGNFLDNYQTNFVWVPPCGVSWVHEGAYYIDMVSLYDCTSFDYTANAGEDGAVCVGEGVVIGTDEASNRKYSWSPATGLSDSTAGRPVAMPQQTTTYVLAVIDEFIQQTTDTVTVYVDEGCGTFPVYVANIFTPNGDGNNDMLFVHSQNVKEISFRVYNRWGKLVFETESLNTGWDGQCRSNDCPAGVYFYVAEVTFESGESVVRKGNVTVVR